VPIGILALVWQWIELPSLASERSGKSANPFALLKRTQVALGMTSILLLFAGQFALFTYLRPFLDNIVRFDVPELSILLFAMGAAGVAGTALISRLLNTRLYGVLTIIPLVMAVIAAALVLIGTSPAATACLLVAWGFFGTAAPVGWGTWLSRALSADAEIGGGLKVAVIQFAITAGAAFGGLMFDTVGWWSAFLLASTLLVGSSATAFAAWLNWNRLT
jgi:predicted MFS family arabinose efflux permease